MAVPMNQLILLEEIRAELPALLPQVRFRNVTNDRLVALSFNLKGASLTQVSMTYAQRTDLPFSGMVTPPYKNELATWLPNRDLILLETAEPITPRGDSPSMNALRDALLEIRSLDRKPAAPLYLASRFTKRHSQYVMTRRFGLQTMYEPGSAGVASVRVLEAVDRLIGVRMSAQGQAVAVCWTSLGQVQTDPRRLTQTRPWTDLVTLSGGHLVPQFSKPFGASAKRPEMILNMGSDVRIHFRFTTQTSTKTVCQFSLDWRVIGAPAIPNPQTCLVYRLNRNDIEIENAAVTGSAPLASDLACTTL